jgi:hypothetical protein
MTEVLGTLHFGGSWPKDKVSVAFDAAVCCTPSDDYATVYGAHELPNGPMCSFERCTFLSKAELSL